MIAVIVHPHKSFDTNGWARKGINKACESLDDIIILSNHSNSDELIEEEDYVGQELSKGYVNSDGRLFYSRWGRISDEIFEIINDSDIMLMGGNFGSCHYRCYIGILERAENKLKFFFPVNSIYNGASSLIFYPEAYNYLMKKKYLDGAKQLGKKCRIKYVF